MTQKILVLNAGSSTDKCLLFETDSSSNSVKFDPIWKGLIDWSGGLSDAVMQITTKDGTSIKKTISVKERAEALKILLETSWTGETKVIPGPDAVKIVGHRVVHGGEHFQTPTLITPKVQETIKSLIPLAPLHNPPQLEGIRILERQFKGIPQVAVFDTAFHSTISEEIATYPGPIAWRKESIKRYGFHGISHEYCSTRAAQLLQKDPAQLKLITCHLGNGCSLAAVKNGRSINTTMGFTPLEGLMMGTRCGSIDPGILLYLLSQKKMTVKELEHNLNFESGLKGISGGDGDMRQVQEMAQKGDPQAQLAFDMFVHHLKYHLCGLAGTLKGLDAIVFTAGIGENSSLVRANACEGLDFLDVYLDPKKNEKCRPDQAISKAGSKVVVLVIHTREEFAIAQACWGKMKDQK